MHYNSHEGDSRVQHGLNPNYYKSFFMTERKDSEFENSGNKLTSATIHITGGHP
jgi:hypothetical protein